MNTTNKNVSYFGTVGREVYSFIQEDCSGNLFMGVAHAVGFTPPADNSAPRDGTGGASRGSFFTPPA